MGQVSYYLKKSESKIPGDSRKKDDKYLICLQFRFPGKDASGKPNRIRCSFGELIDGTSWDEKKQRVRSNKKTTQNGEYLLNETLDNLEDHIVASYRKELASGYPTKEKMLSAVKSFFVQTEEVNLFSLIDRFISGEIKHGGKEKSKETLKKYGTTKNRLLDFQKKKNYPVGFETINLDFFSAYVTYMRSNGMKQNTIAKDVAVIKVFMNEAFDRGYTANVQHKSRKFSATWSEVDSVYLTNEEIMHIYHHDLSEKRPMLGAVRDLFVLGCFTGLRFSDYSTIKPENITSGKKGKRIALITKKTGAPVEIPCHPVVVEILEKYGSANKLPKAPSIQKFNNYLKEICEDAEMNETGRLKSEPKKELWQAISSHTARRSFVTNLYLEGFPTIDIMKITGHTTEKAFMKYIKIQREQVAERLQQHQQKKWNEKAMHAVA